MKPLTPKQRRGIYLKAAKYLGEKIGNEWMGICPAIEMSSGQTDRGLYQNLFPEFWLFQPEGYGVGKVWWRLRAHEDNINVRVIATLLMSEMTKTAKQ